MARRSPTRLVGALSLAAFAAVLLVATGPAAGEAHGRGSVLVAKLDAPVTPIMADHLGDALDAAERDGHRAFVVEIDTPGGLVTSMRDIVQSFLAAEIPVIAYVTPSGAQAASAGALIAWSANIVAMTPGTTVGAATPVDIGGGEVGDKIVEDAAAFARAVAEERDRNIEVAESAVTEGKAFSASEAIDLDVADLRVDTLADLLVAVDGTEVTLGDGSVTVLETADAEVDEFQMSVLRRVLQFLADPNVAFILMSLGTLGIIYELANPGEWIAGGIGVVLLLLGFVSVAILPVQIAGFLFLALAIALFIAELFAPGVGVAAVLGAVSLVLAGLFMFRETPGLTVSLAAVVPTAAVLGLGVVLASRLALRVRLSTPVSGTEHLVGREVVVAESEGTTGQVRLEGAWWRVRGNETLETGERVRVVAVDSIELVVEPVAEHGRAEASVDGEERS